LKPPEYNFVGAAVMGYIIKRMEAKMRVITRFKFKLSPNTSSVISTLKYSNYKNKALYTLLADPKFDEIIDNSVVAYFQKNHPRVFNNSNAPYEKPVVVEIDTSKLDKIRSEAEEIQEKLTIATEVEEMINDITINNMPTVVEEKIIVDNAAKNEWEQLFYNLSSVQRLTITTILSNSRFDDKLSELAKQNNVLVEVLLESINEIALECVGDNIIETSETPIYIYEDYIENIEEILRRN